MRTKKIRLLIAIVSGILLIGMLGIYITLSQMGNQTEKTTARYSATVDTVEVNQSRRKMHIEIFVKEFSNSFYISENISQSINLDDITALQSGDTVFFSIESDYVDQMNQAFFVPIIALETENMQLLSLEQYNHIIKQTLLPSQIACAIIAILFLTVAVISACSLRKQCRKKPL